MNKNDKLTYKGKNFFHNLQYRKQGIFKKRISIMPLIRLKYCKFE